MGEKSVDNHAVKNKAITWEKRGGDLQGRGENAPTSRGGDGGRGKRGRGEGGKGEKEKEKEKKRESVV